MSRREKILCILIAFTAFCHAVAEDLTMKEKHVIVVEQAKERDPFSPDAYGQVNREIARVIEEVRNEPPVPGQGLFSVLSKERYIASITKGDADLKDMSVIAYATTVHAGDPDGHSYACQVLLLCQYLSKSEKRPIAMVCLAQQSPTNIHRKWTISNPETPFLRPVLVAEWPLEEGLLNKYLSGTDFGYRNFLLTPMDFVVVSSYLPKYKRFNKALEAPHSSEESKKLLHQYNAANRGSRE